MAEQDLIVVGGGPAGYIGALKAARMGKNTVLIEKDALGGTCLNVGCIPTKYLLDKAGIIEKIRLLTEEGIFKEAGLFNYTKVLEGKEKIVKQLTDGVAYLLKNAGVTVIKGEAEIIGQGKVKVDDQLFVTKNILITTGSKTGYPPIEGAKENTINSTEALFLPSIPKRLVIVGAGVIGLEMATIFSTLGSQVVLLEMLQEILPDEEADLVNIMAKALGEKGVQIKLGATIKKIYSRGNAAKTIEFEQNSKLYTVEADKVLMAAGRVPNLLGINDKKNGIELDNKGFIKTDDYLRTSLANVYAAGDVIGGWQLAHSAYAEAEIAVENMFKQEKKFDSGLMPRCVYTNPPFASVGLTANQAQKRAITITEGRFLYNNNGMALAGNNSKGVVKILADSKTERILGVHIVGAEAHELIATAGLAIKMKVTASDFEDLIIAHPSLSEMLKESILDCKGLSFHTPI